MDISIIHITANSLSINLPKSFNEIQPKVNLIYNIVTPYTHSLQIWGSQGKFYCTHILADTVNIISFLMT